MVMQFTLTRLKTSELPSAGRPKAALVLSPEQQKQLEALARSSLPAGLVSRFKIILLSAAGKTNSQIARQLELTNTTVGKWRRRFLEQDLDGLRDAMRPGRPRKTVGTVGAHGVQPK